MKENQLIPAERWKRISRVYDFILSQPKLEKKAVLKTPVLPVKEVPIRGKEWKQASLFPGVEHVVFRRRKVIHRVGR